MPVYVFFIESSAKESFNHIFSEKEISSIDAGTFIPGIDTSNIDDMIIEVSNKFRDEVKVVFVDKLYITTYFYTEEGLRYHEDIKLLKEKHEFCNGTWMEFFEKFGGIDDVNNYIFATMDQKYENAYDFSNYLQLSLNPNCYFIWGINDVREAVNAKSYYNIFSNKPKDEQIDTLGNPQYRPEDDESIGWIVEYGVLQVLGMMQAGFHLNEKFVQKFVEPWVLNPASYFSKGIIIEYDLKPPIPDCDNKVIQQGYLYAEYFNICPQYRKQILDGMCRVLCKYGLEFRKISNIPYTIYNVQYLNLLR